VAKKDLKNPREDSREMCVALGDDSVWDKAKGELRILGQRHIAIDAQGLCEHLDLILGSRVAEVVLNQHMMRQGREDAAAARKERPHVAIEELVDELSAGDVLSGVGLVKASVPGASPGRIDVEISNPGVKLTTGAARSFLFSYWCGVFGELLGKEFKIDDVAYDESKNLMKCRIISR